MLIDNAYQYDTVRRFQTWHLIPPITSSFVNFFSNLENHHEKWLHKTSNRKKMAELKLIFNNFSKRDPEKEEIQHKNLFTK